MVNKQKFDLDNKPLEQMVHPAPLSYCSPANLKCDWEVIILENLFLPWPNSRAWWEKVSHQNRLKFKSGFFHSLYLLNLPDPPVPHLDKAYGSRDVRRQELSFLCKKLSTPPLAHVKDLGAICDNHYSTLEWTRINTVHGNDIYYFPKNNENINKLKHFLKIRFSEMS